MGGISGDSAKAMGRRELGLQGAQARGPAQPLRVVQGAATRPGSLRNWFFLDGRSWREMISDWAAIPAAQSAGWPVKVWPAPR
jgi:hypothetical protein